MRLGTNLPAVRDFNQVVVLEAIRREPSGISRVEIAERVNLSPQTVSNVCARLLEDELVIEAGSRRSGVGTPRRILKLNPPGRFAVGIHLDPSVITVVLLDLAGAVRAHRSIPTPPTARVSDTIDRIVFAIQGVVAASGVDAGRLLGVGVAAPGPMDLVSGTMIGPPLLDGWDGFPVRDTLAAQLDMHVLLEKDVTAAVVGETWAGKNGDDFVFFYYGTGVGVGFAFQNQVFRGLTGNAGEVGQLLVGGRTSSGAGGQARLGPSVEPRNLVRQAAERGVLESLPSEVGFTEVQAAFETLALRARSGNEVALGLVDTLAANVSSALVSVIDLVDVDRVVFGGPYWYPVATLLLDRVPSLVLNSPELAYPHPIAFGEATFGQDVVAVGAACLVLDDVLSPNSSAGLSFSR